MCFADVKKDQICLKNKAKFSKQYEDIKALGDDFKQMIEDSKLFQSKNTETSCESSRVKELADHTKDWTDRGDERWCKKGDTSAACQSEE